MLKHTNNINIRYIDDSFIIWHVGGQAIRKMLMCVKSCWFIADNELQLDKKRISLFSDTLDKEHFVNMVWVNLIGGDKIMLLEGDWMNQA